MHERVHCDDLWQVIPQLGKLGNLGETASGRLLDYVALFVVEEQTINFD